ncbi:hypothetical protein DL96DRAFT_1712657 [Flagelloscypha sp. PMI_526]|nr:hypothetical protein DL96DRAFT_1712657 [Flagelloscypha sp. PMI_526]
MPKQASSSTSSANALTPPPTLSRPFRSRKNRPCDACRRAKTRCAIPDVGPPCVECQQTRKQCTFDELPPERKKAKPPASQPPTSPVEYIELPSTSRLASIAQNYRSAEDAQVGRLDALVVAASEERQMRMRGEPPSLDLSTDESLEPHVITSLVTDDLLPIGSKRTGPESYQLSSSTPYIRQVSYDPAKPQYVVFNRRAEKKSPTAAEEQLQFVHTCLSLLQPPPNTSHLTTLFFENFNIAFPIVLLGNYEGHPNEPQIRSQTCLLGLVHSRHYRASSKAMLQLLASRHFPETSTGRLCCITTSLLDLAARPTLDVEKNYLTLARTIAQAQLLGLHIDPTNWAIPTWEKDYRRILWWALRTFDHWMSFLNSRPSHIQTSNHNVPVPSIQSVCSVTNENTKIPHAPSARSFVFLCRLSMLVGHLQSEVFTLAASIEITKEDRIGRVVGLEGETTTLLQEVKSFVAEARSSSGVPSLMMCLLGFRCMLRRIRIEILIGLGSPFTPDNETLDMYAEAVDFFCSLDGRDFDGFWLNYVGHILSSMTSSLIRLSLATTASMQNQTRTNPQAAQMQIQVQANSPTNPLLLLSRLRGALDRAQREFSWDLADAALTRAEKVVQCLVEGVQTPSPAPSASGGSPPSTSAPAPGTTSNSHSEYLESVIAALEGRYYVGGMPTDHVMDNGTTGSASAGPSSRRPSSAVPPPPAPPPTSVPHTPLTPNGHHHLPHPQQPQHPPTAPPHHHTLPHPHTPSPLHHSQPHPIAHLHPSQLPPLSMEVNAAPSAPPSGQPVFVNQAQDVAMNIDLNAFGMGWQGHGISLSPGEWDFRGPGSNGPPGQNGTGIYGVGAGGAAGH